MIKLEQVSKRFLKHRALDHINLELQPGNIIGLVGANGSGKSTTLKLIAGLIQPSSGRITVNGNQVNRRICSEVSYLSELDEYYSFYTVGETIHFYASQFKDFNLEKAHHICEFMKLDTRKKVKHLSKGNRGRLKIVLTLAREVPVILMDEPLSGLDPMVRDSIVRGLISFIELEKQIILITTHEIQEIEAILDQVIAIKDGEIISKENVENLRHNSQVSIVDWMKEIYQ